MRSHAPLLQHIKAPPSSQKHTPLIAGGHAAAAERAADSRFRKPGCAQSRVWRAQHSGSAQPTAAAGARRHSGLRKVHAGGAPAGGRWLGGGVPGRARRSASVRACGAAPPAGGPQRRHRQVQGIMLGRLRERLPACIWTGMPWCSAPRLEWFEGAQHPDWSGLRVLSTWCMNGACNRL